MLCQELLVVVVVVLLPLAVVSLHGEKHLELLLH
jgi:hypothetical protein